MSTPAGDEPTLFDEEPTLFGDLDSLRPLRAPASPNASVEQRSASAEAGISSARSMNEAGTDREGSDGEGIDGEGIASSDDSRAAYEKDAGKTPSWLDTLTDEDAEPEDASSLSLFEGDAGALTLAQRKTLVAVVKQRFITAAKQPGEWRVLMESEALLRSRLNDLFLDLHVDRNRQVAFKRQAVPEAGGRFPTLLHDTAWGREETILLVFLRTRFRSERNEGAEEVIVDREELLQQVAHFRPVHATDTSGDQRKSENAIETLKRTGILIKTSDEHRLLVSPVIEVLLPVEKLQQLLQWFTRHNGISDTAGATGDTASAGADGTASAGADDTLLAERDDDGRDEDDGGDGDDGGDDDGGDGEHAPRAKGKGTR